MDVNTVLLVVLRLLHIVTAFVWFGMGITLTFFVVPAALASGEGGMRFARTFLTKGGFARIIPAVAGLTTLFGLILYALGSHTRFTTVGNIVLGIGALAGLAATVYDGAVLSRATRAFAGALAADVPETGTLAQSAVANLNALAQRLQQNARLGTVLMVVALLGMGLARYL